MHLDEAREARLQLVLKVPQGWRRFAALRCPEREFTYCFVATSSLRANCLVAMRSSAVKRKIAYYMYCSVDSAGKQY